MKDNILYIVIAGLFVYILFFNESKQSNDNIKELEKTIIDLKTKIDSIDLKPLINNIEFLENEIHNFNIDSVYNVKTRDSLRAVYNPK